MDTLRKQKRKLKKQIRAASSEETNGLLVIWCQLKARHSALSRAESTRKKHSQVHEKEAQPKEAEPGTLHQGSIPVCKTAFPTTQVWNFDSRKRRARNSSEEDIFRSRSRDTLGRNYRPCMASCPRNKVRHQASKLTGSHNSSKQS
ncbi:hypothetical protein PoB_003110300 [Plakobranchus ocellatus]|uniref:Uncharacterized protein n=1 Tax=Plakobranchus ocellatus TaxID=259542 RepID=A0AAV4ABG6_9GAST|nr:hypothetical protein PoB_003110300 [Plakobranchus ocellatus]